MWDFVNFQDYVQRGCKYINLYLYRALYLRHDFFILDGFERNNKDLIFHGFIESCIPISMFFFCHHAQVLTSAHIIQTNEMLMTVPPIMLGGGVAHFKGIEGSILNLYKTTNIGVAVSNYSKFAYKCYIRSDVCHEMLHSDPTLIACNLPYNC